MCDGWTCTPGKILGALPTKSNTSSFSKYADFFASLGTVETQIKVPCGVNFGYKKVDLCKLARGNIPGADELIRQSAGFCKCLPQLISFVSLDTVKNFFKSADLSSGSGDILQKYGSSQQVCLVHPEKAEISFNRILVFPPIKPWIVP